ncbi:MAG: C39 family peptidase [Deltaproteobacteria bacterium]|nr:C39 family peptidase [Deltaproteobacteria bacterium]
MGNKWNVRWTSPANATLDDPIELVFVRAPNAPARARIEIWEADAREHEIDDYDKRKQTKEDDDKIATFEGDLVPEAARPEGVRFEVDSVVPHYSGPQGADTVKIRFEGSADVHTLAIPHYRGEPIDLGEDDKHIVGDGEFYEIYVKIIDAGSGKVRHTVAVHNLRRKLDVLLAVEPLNQADASMANPLAKQILRYFHPDGPDTSNRNWGGVVCRDTKEGLLSMGSSGCSYASFTMVLRYLRVLVSPDADPTLDESWITLYDKFVKDLEEDYRPAMFSKGPGMKALNKLRGKVKSKRKANGWTAVSEVKWDENKVARTEMAEDSFRYAPNHAHWWPMRVAWLLRQHDEAKYADEFTELPAYVDCTKEDGTIERVDLDATNWIVPEQEKSSGRIVNGSKKPVGPTDVLKKYFELKTKTFSINATKGDNWATFVKDSLDAGLPLIANIKTGRYLREGSDPGGHFVVIVGYRHEGDRVRFIINDPAGAKKLQYACLFEDEMAVTEGSSDHVKKVTLTAVAYRHVDDGTKKKKKKKKKGEEQARSELIFEPEQFGTSTSLSFTLDGAQHDFSITVEPSVWAEASSQLKRVHVVSSHTKGLVAPATVSDHLGVGGAKKSKSLPEGDFFRIGKETSTHVWTDATDPTITYTVELSIVTVLTRDTGPRPPKAWEGRGYNVLLGRRRFDSLAILFLYRPKQWPAGAARFMPVSAAAAAAG